MKRIILAGILVLVLGMLALPVFAVPTQNLASLANFYPADTLIYVGFRTDDGFLDELEALFQRAAAVSGANPEDFSRGINQLAVAASGNPDATFESVIRPWLGDTGAFGITDAGPLTMFGVRGSDSPEESYLVAFSITDRATAQAFFTNSDVFNEQFEITEEIDDYTIISPSAANDNERPPYFYFGNSVLLIATDPALFPQAEFSERLSDNPNFTDTLTMLPAGDYSVASYFDIATFFQQFSETMSAEMGSAASGEMMSNMLALYEEAYHGMGIGYTLLEQDNLTMDVSVNADLEALLEATGMSVPAYGVVNPEFAARVPADAAFTLFYPDIATAIEQGIAQLGTVMEMQQQMMEEMGVPAGQAQSFEDQIAALQFGIQAVTGGTLEESFGWATGQSALAFGFDYSAFPNGMNSMPTRNPFNLSFVLENVDGGAQGLYDGLTTFLQGMGSSVPDLTITDKPIVGGEATNISITIDDTPFPIEVQIAVTDSIFVIGTPAYVEAALIGDGGLGATPAFQTATQVMLNGTPAYMYIAFEPLASLARMSMGSGGAEEAIFALLESASFSGQVELPNTSSVRFVLTLAE